MNMLVYVCVSMFMVCDSVGVVEIWNELYVDMVYDSELLIK